MVVVFFTTGGEASEQDVRGVLGVAAKDVS